MHRAIWLATLLLAALPSAALGRAGALDRSFGDRGKVVKAVDLESQPYEETRVAMARLADGTIVVAAGKTLLAFHADGTVDRGFGGGRVEVVPPVPDSVRLTAVAGMPDGGVLVGGTFTSAFASSNSDPSGEGVFLARYRPDGMVDPRLGGGGVLLTSFDFPPPVDRTYPSASPWAAARVTLEGMTADSSGRIVLDGSRLVSVGPCRGGSAGYREAFAARLRDNGELDLSFGEGGVTILPEAENAGRPLLTEAGGTYIPALASTACSPPKPRLLIRLGANGQRVPSFASGGVLQLSEEEFGWPLQIARDRRGRVVLVSTLSPLYRILPSGSPDETFGRHGYGSSIYSGLGYGAVAVDHSERILLAGTSSSPEGPPGAFLIGRFTRQGHRNESFGSDGEVLTRFGRHSQARATAIKIASGGRILVAGTLARPSLPGGEGIALARYLPGR